MLRAIWVRLSSSSKAFGLFQGIMLPFPASANTSNSKWRRGAAFAAVILAIPIGAGFAHASETKTYAYDAQGRLVGAVSANGSITTTSIYSFDPASNRQWVTVAQADGTKLPIFRFVAALKHFYTASYLEGHQAGESSEGLAFYMLSSGGVGRIPLYRCYDAGGDEHFISSQSNCEGLSQEGVIGYAYTAPTSGFVPLYRFFNATVNDHLITVNYGEGSSCCTYEGILGYVPQ